MLFIPHFYSRFYENIHLASNQSLRQISCFSSRCQDLIRAHPCSKRIRSMIERILLHIWKNLSEARRERTIVVFSENS